MRKYITEFNWYSAPGMLHNWKQLFVQTSIVCLLFVPTLTAADTHGFALRDRLANGSEGPEMVSIRADCYQMGSPESEKGRVSNERRHEVCVNAFAFGRHEITNAQFRKFRPSHDSGSIEGHHSLNDNPQPVVNVSWNDATAYAEWLSQQTGQKYRLPTEAEWEYAARGGSYASRFWGDNPDRACEYANVHEHTSAKQLSGHTWTHHHCDDSYPASAPVGSMRPNGFGLFDMLANVWEWTCSVYQADYNGAELGCANKDSSDDRVLRGGSWLNFPQRVRSAYRGHHTADSADAFHGFRLVRVPPTKP